jgi:hypothetical protein
LSISAIAPLSVNWILSWKKKEEIVALWTGTCAAKHSAQATAISGSIPGLGITCELSLQLLILSLALRVFLRVLRFSRSLRKNQHS